MIAEVIIQSNVKKLNRIFDYKVPTELEEKINVGSRVLVPFGNKKSLEDGFVIGLKMSSEYEVKEIANIQEESILDEEKINLAKWMSRRYFCNISDCLKLMLPPGTTSKIISNRVKEKNLNFVILKKDIDEEVKKVLDTKVENVIKDTPAENGDTVVIDFEGFVNGVAFDGGKADNYPLELGSKSFIPGFEDQLIGAKSEDEVEVNVTFPKDYHESLAGKDATFKVKVHEVKGKVYPELNDELVKELEISGVQTVDAYLDYVKADLKKRKEQEAESHLVNSLVDAVCKASYAEFPKSLIDSEVENQVKRVEEQAKQYKMPVEVLLQYSGMASLDDFKKNAEDYARKSFLQELVIDKIIELEKIEASDKEIEAEYKKIAGVKDQDKDADKKIAQVKKQYRINQVAYQVKANKVIELLKANAITKTQKSE